MEYRPRKMTVNNSEGNHFAFSNNFLYVALVAQNCEVEVKLRVGFAKLYQSDKARSKLPKLTDWR